MRVQNPGLKFTSCLFCAMFLLAVFPNHTYGQLIKKGKFITKEYLEKDISTFSESDLFNFPNVNKLPFYYNRFELRKIAVYQENNDWKNMFMALRNYVKNFGVENFYRDTYLIWRLAKLTEKYGNPNEAILLYKLVLKHHREDINIAQVELNYDSIQKNNKDYFVPIEFYHNLVQITTEIDTLKPPGGELMNLGIEVNSNFDDYGPAMNLKSDTLFFTSKRNIDLGAIDRFPNEDLYISIRTDGYWSDAKPLTEINTTFNEGSPAVTQDGRVLYFTRCYGPDSYGDCDIFSSKRDEKGEWSIVENLGVNVNSKAWDSHPSLNHTGDTLYFASDRIGGFGLSDIYYSVKDENGNWTRAQNVGPIINTRNNELSPFHHHLFNVLYFSSNGHPLNFGNFDIYKSYKIGSNWGEPKNIGPLVNSPGNEIYFTIDSDSRDIFYSRTNPKKELDLYSFPLPMGGQPDATVTLIGTITNEETNEPFRGIASIIDLDQGIEVAPKFLRPDGTFEFDLINNNNYLLIVRGEEFLKIEELFYLSGDTEYIQKTPVISSKIEFESVVFDGGSFELKSEMFGDLDKIAEFMFDNLGFKLRINGHTDSDGQEEFNLDLSQRRADAIKEYIVYFGKIEPNRIEARGYGSSKPIRKGSSEEDKQLNRRVEFELYKEKGGS